jgi:hypothetical protein
MPHVVRRLAQDVVEDVVAVAVAPGPRENDNREAHLLPIIPDGGPTRTLSASPKLLAGTEMAQQRWKFIGIPGPKGLTKRL